MRCLSSYASPCTSLLIIFFSVIFPLNSLTAQSLTKATIEEALKEKIAVKNWQAWLEKVSSSSRANSSSNGQYPTELPTSNFQALTASAPQQIRLGHTQKPESEVHAAIHPLDSNQIIAITMRHDPFVNDNPISFSIYSTKNFGESWTESVFRGLVPGSTPIAGGGDPVVAFESTGKAHFVWLLLKFNPSTFKGEIGLYHAISEDGGKSWNLLPKPFATSEVGFSPGSGQVAALENFIDKPWIAVDRSESQFRDQMYIAYLDMALQPDTIPKISILRKTKNALTFSGNPVQVNTTRFADLQFATVDVDMESHVHVGFYGTQNGNPFAQNVRYSLYHARSENRGTSFLPEQKISDVIFPRPRAKGDVSNDTTLKGVTRMYPSPQIKVDKSNSPYRGNLYAVWTAQGITEKVTEGFDIYFSRSTDGGDTWSTPIVVNDDLNPATHQFHPSIEVSPNGLLLISWYDRRDDPFNVRTHYYMTFSRDGGQSFGEQFPVSMQAADFAKVGTVNDGFGIGEYTQMLASPHHAIPIWADGRRNDGSIQVYAAFLPTGQNTVNIDRLEPISEDLALNAVYPNPAKDHITIQWWQRYAGPIEISLMDIKGKLVQHIAKGEYAPGEHEFVFNLDKLASSTYLILLKSKEGISQQRLEIAQ